MNFPADVQLMNAGVGLNMESQREKIKGAGSEALPLSNQPKGVSRNDVFDLSIP